MNFSLCDFISLDYRILFLILSVKIASNSADAPISYWDDSYAQPYFDNSTRRDITVTIGQTATLHCRVRNLGDRAVSWIRKRDLHIMTIGILTYTNDQRYQALHTEGSDEWSLRISSAQTRDSGVFECQVSTEPKISTAYRLNVVVSKAKILGNHELFVKSGSDINLTCVASQVAQPPSFIYWYKGGRVVNYSQRGGINVQTDRNTKTSKLIISRATVGDSGNYTCAPSNSDASSILVHVISGGEHQAAMKHGNNSASSLFSHTKWKFYSSSRDLSFSRLQVLFTLKSSTVALLCSLLASNTFSSYVYVR